LKGNGGGGQCACASCAEVLDRDGVNASGVSSSSSSGGGGAPKRGSVRPKWAPGPKNGAALIMTVDPLDLHATDDPSLATLSDKQTQQPPFTPPKPPHSIGSTAGAAIPTESASSQLAITSDSGSSVSAWVNGDLIADSNGAAARTRRQIVTDEVVNNQSAKPSSSPRAMRRDGLVAARMHSSSAHDFTDLTAASSNASRAVSAPISTSPAASKINRQPSGPAEESSMPIVPVASAVKEEKGVMLSSGTGMLRSSSDVGPQSLESAAPSSKRGSGMLAAAFAQRAAAKEKAKLLTNSKDKPTNDSNYNNKTHGSLNFTALNLSSISSGAFEGLKTDGAVSSSSHKKSSIARRPNAGLL